MTLSGENDMKPRLTMLVAAICLAAPPLSAQQWSWDPMKDVDSVLPQGVPNEGKVIQP